MQGKKALVAAASNVKKSSASSQGTKRPLSPNISLPSVVIPKLSLSDIPAAKKLATGPKVQSGVKTLKKPSTSVSHAPKQHFPKDLTQYEKATLPSGLSYLKPISPPPAAHKPIPKSAPKASGVAQPRKITVYPIDMPVSAYGQKQPPPAHGGSTAAARKPSSSGMSGLDFSKAATSRSRPPSPPSDVDVIVLDDSD